MKLFIKNRKIMDTKIQYAVVPIRLIIGDLISLNTLFQGTTVTCDFLIEK